LGKHEGALGAWSELKKIAAAKGNTRSMVWALPELVKISPELFFTEKDWCLQELPFEATIAATIAHHLARIYIGADYRQEQSRGRKILDEAISIIDKAITCPDYYKCDILHFFYPIKEALYWGSAIDTEDQKIIAAAITRWLSVIVRDLATETVKVERDLSVDIKYIQELLIEWKARIDQ
jgi:hypothetical protein